VLHFLLGYSLFRSVDLPGVETALFFALTFVAGHLVQEARDHDGDRLRGSRTNAVAFGKAQTFAAGLVIFTLADLLLVVLALRGVVPLALSLVAILCPIQLLLAIRPLREGLVPGGVRAFQWHYRVLYTLFGAVILVALFFRA
jgi:4-hydroxybenzoate polyprenyltransferase